MKHKITEIFTITALISLTLFAGETKEVSFNINGMTCQGCVGKVSGILDNTPGVSNYKVSIENKKTMTFRREAYIAFIRRFASPI